MGGGTHRAPLRSRGRALWSVAGGDPTGPVLAVVGGTHGDEPEGAGAVEALVARPAAAWAATRAREVRLAIGNPEALAASRRFTAGGVDLNRCFGDDALADETEESQRAAELAAFVGGVDVLLDLHQTHAPTPPLAVAADTPRHLDLAARLGLHVAVVGAGRVYGAAMLADAVDRAGGIGLTVETGQAGTAAALAEALRVVDALLAGGVGGAAAVRVYEIVDVLPSPGVELRFTRPLTNGSTIRPGEIIGRSSAGPLVVPVGDALFLPRERAAAGAPCALLATDRGMHDVP